MMDYPPLTATMRAYPPLTAADHEALARSIALARAASEQQRAQIDRMLIDEGFWRAARFSSYACQDSRLELKPWEIPVCWLRDADPDTLLQSLKGKRSDQNGHRRAALLLKKLLENNLSRFEPDPLGALERVEAKAKAARVN
jgi:hypothetical protein